MEYHPRPKKCRIIIGNGPKEKRSGIGPEIPEKRRLSCRSG
jgi:hypothetical protein